MNRALADALFGGGNALGARIRYVGRSREANARDITLNRWYEIVGVVPDFPPVHVLDTERRPRVYHAARLGDPGRQHPGRQPARLQNDNLAIAQQSAVEQHLRNLGRFSRAGWRNENQLSVRLRRFQQLLLNFKDR